MNKMIEGLLLRPFPLTLLLTGLAVASLWRQPRAGRRRLLALTAAYLAVVVTSLPLVVYPLMGSLEWAYPPVAVRPPGAEAIVVLSGGVERRDATRLKDGLASDTIARCLHAAELYHEGSPCPVVVTGGTLDPARYPPVAPLMRDLLVRLGVRDSDILVEPRARTTFENATETRAILRERGLRKIVLVTEAYHMNRALACFRKQGIDAVPAACNHQATEFDFEPALLIPSHNAIYHLVIVLHEWVGFAMYRLRGQL